MGGCQRGLLMFEGLKVLVERGDLYHAQPSVWDTRVHNVSLQMFNPILLD